MSAEPGSELPPRVRAFHTCEHCSFDFATDEGERNCHYYECPILPDELDVRCPICLYNFATGDGNPGCSDPPTCVFARKVAPARVRALEAWMKLRGL